jgi:hypothetical protein
LEEITSNLDKLDLITPFILKYAKIYLIHPFFLHFPYGDDNLFIQKFWKNYKIILKIHVTYANYHLIFIVGIVINYFVILVLKYISKKCPEISFYSKRIKKVPIIVIKSNICTNSLEIGRKFISLINDIPNN